MSEEPRKRSRFDQTEPEARRGSRFDRRSRSPGSRRPDAGRARSPPERHAEGSASGGLAADKKDPTAAAAAAAARINAEIQARKSGITHVDVPPIRSASGQGIKSPNKDVDSAVSNEVYVQDGDYIRDVEINDLRNKYTLTKGQTQKTIKEETGADVTTRGEYLPDKSMATAAKPPLYLHITSQTKEGLEKAVKMVEDMMKQDLPNLVDERRFRRREPEQFERDELGRRKWPEERIPIDLEPINGFNLRAQVVGHGGAYVKHIQQESRCRVQIKGRGSGFTENSTGQESDEPMFLHVAGPDPAMVERAKELCEDLLKNVKEQYELFKERGPPQDRFNRHDGGGRGYGQHQGSRYGDRDRDRDNGYGGGYGSRDYSQGGGGGGGGGGGYGGHQSPANNNPLSPTAPGTGAAAQSGQPDYSQYAQYYQNGQDPYAAYGGYQNYVAWYYSYYQQQQSGQSSDQQASGNAPAAYGQQSSSSPPPPPGSSSGGAPGAAPPPPPPDDSAPPPPPGGPPGAPPSGPPGGPPGTGTYQNVPPPPGM